MMLGGKTENEFSPPHNDSHCIDKASFCNFIPGKVLQQVSEQVTKTFFKNRALCGIQSDVNRALEAWFR